MWSGLQKERVGLLIIWIFTLTDTGRLLKDKILLRLPLFGNLIKQNILSKFGKTFGILISAGVSVMDSMELLVKVLDKYIKKETILF